MQGKNIFQLTLGPVATNCWIYRTGENEAIVIDPGDEADTIISALEEFNLFPYYILLTHGHFDHIGALPRLVEKYRNINPKIAIHKLDAGYLGTDSYKIHSQTIRYAMGDMPAVIDPLWEKIPAADRLLEEGDNIGPLSVLHLPGHTPGSCAFWDKEEGILFSGDTLFRYSCGRTDLPGGNEEQLMGSLHRLFEMERGIEVYPGHGETTAIGCEADEFF